MSSICIPRNAAWPLWKNIPMRCGRFCAWLPVDKGVDKARAIAYKAYLIENYATASVNAELAALNGFVKFQGWEDCRVKPLRIQRQIFASTEKELSRQEYERLVETAEQQRKEKLSLLLQLMAATGLRVSEIKYITVDTVRQGRAEIRLKGKIRVILLPGKLCRKLQKYIRAEKNHRRSGVSLKKRKAHGPKGNLGTDETIMQGS